MGAKSGLFLKSVQWFNRGVLFCCSGIILGIYSYFLATLHNHNLDIANWIRAVEGISGAAALYSAIGLLLLCCLAGRTVSSFLAIALDVAFTGAFVYVAISNRGGAGSCRGQVDTPFGTADSDTNVSDNGNQGFTNLPRFGTACRLETACFAVAIIAIFFFIFAAITEWALARHHNKAKRFGPSPANDYTSGYGKKKRTGTGLFGGLFSRNRKSTRSTNTNYLPEHTHPDEVRDSYATEQTRVGTANPADTGLAGNKYANANFHGHQNGIHSNPNADALPMSEPAHYSPANHRYDDGVYNSR